MALPEFQNEQDFRNNWIAPFLAKLGFMVVKNTHGPGEQGKDFFFADYDRFGHTRIFAAQAKIGNIGSGSTEISDLLDQVKRCFGVRLRFHKAAHEQRVAAVYVMTTGTISVTARERIHDWCVGERFGENVFFLDGEQLENKERFTTYENDQQRRQHLTAFRNELIRNGVQLKRQHQNFMQGNVFLGIYRLKALEDALLWVSLQGDQHLMNTMEDLWRFVTLFKEYKTPTKVNWDDDSKEMFRDTTGKCIGLVDDLVKFCDEQLQLLDARYSLQAVSLTAEPPV